MHINLDINHIAGDAKLELFPTDGAITVVVSLLKPLLNLHRQRLANLDYDVLKYHDRFLSIRNYH